MKITVFTPTYNRGYIIENLFKSLQRQTFRDFEWIVVDDGSSDGTDELFAKIECESNPFPIRYLKTANGGKHRAINIGVQIAQGDLFFIVDSDDYLTDNALEKIVKVEQTIPEHEKAHFCGVCGLRGFSEKTWIGKTYEGDYLDITSLERPKYGIQGDKAEVFYTAILKKYPFPEFEGENFITECVVWDKIASDGYKLRFFNEIVYICDYLPDGLSAHSNELFQKNPQGRGLYLYQSALYGKIHGVDMWKQYLGYYYSYRNILSFLKIAKYLHMNPVKLYLRLFGIRVFYKLYD